MTREPFTSVHLRGDADDYEVVRDDDIIWIQHEANGDRVTILALSIEDPRFADKLAARLLGMFHDRLDGIHARS